MGGRNFNKEEWLMSWEEAIAFYNIPKKYQQVTLESRLVHPKIRKSCEDWMRLPFPGLPSLYLFGITGCGKTYLSYCILRCLLESKRIGIPGKWALFVRSCDLDRELLNSMGEGTEGNSLRKYHEAPLLFLDDLGTEMKSERQIRQLFSVVDTRSSNELTTIYSSNVPPKDLSAVFGDRIASRLSLAIPIEFPAVDLRRESK